MTRLATLAEGGRIGLELVQAEVARLRWQWAVLNEEGEGATGATSSAADAATLLGDEAWQALDLFDRIQLEGVLAVCRRARTLSDAGRTLYQASRAQRSVVNDADRLRKYLVRFGLSWEQVAR